MFALKQEPEVAGFWAWFDENQARLAHVATTLDDMKMDDLEPVLTELADILHEADERLFAELGADAAGKPQLVVTADGELDAMLTARDLVAIAPAYDGWTFSALRERAEVPETIMLPGGPNWTCAKPCLFWKSPTARQKSPLAWTSGMMRALTTTTARSSSSSSRCWARRTMPPALLVSWRCRCRPAGRSGPLAGQGAGIRIRQAVGVSAGMWPAVSRA
jgi:hypothetical protein